MEGFQGQGWGLWEEGRGWVSGEGTEVEGRAREAEGREDQRALGAGGVGKGTGWPGEGVC